MSEFRTFTGKNLDEAMEEACRHFDAKREKLEIEIIDGGSSGIFGLVGKKKAKIKARLREEIQLLAEVPASKPEPQTPPRPVEAEAAPEPQAALAPEEPRAEQPAAAQTPSGDSQPLESSPEPDSAEPAPAEPIRAEQPRSEQPRAESGRGASGRGDKRGGGSRGRRSEHKPKESAPEQQAEAPRETAPKPPKQPRPKREDAAPAKEIPQELKDIVKEVVEVMLKGILDVVPELEITGHPERVAVLIDDEENSGLLIGREGQTLSSLQYLVNRIVARRWETPVRVQINTGEYREKQDENLRKMAIYLADKAKSLGRPQSTKPLSSYHRRVVHLVLQEDEAIQTRSKGEGPLKRVLILPKSPKGEGQNGQRPQA